MRTEAMSRHERMAQRFEAPVLLATALVIPAIIVEASAGDQRLKTAAVVLNWWIWLVFLAEICAMLAVAPSRRQWLRANPLVVAIVVLTVPFLPASLQAARLFRLLRVVRLVLVVRLARRLLTPAGIQFAAAIVGLAVLGGAAAFQAAERNGSHPRSLWDGVWWAMSTVTTVGYGDIRPYTTLGRIIGIVLMIVGIGFVALLTGAIAQRFLQPDVQRIEATEGRIEASELDLVHEIRAIADRLAHLEQMVVRERTLRSESG